MTLRCVALALALAACSGKAPRDDGVGVGSAASSIAPRDAAMLELQARPLGMPDLASYAWRKRGGQPAFRAARKAEGREDWPAVVAACRDALAADPGHLEAAWLLAVGLAKTGKPDDVLAPLAVAGAGDFGKWATASLEQPALQPWLATPTGAAWRRRVEQDRQLYSAALARSIVVMAAGDLFAFDPTGARWYRLTRTYGGVLAAIAEPTVHRIAYITHQRAGALALGVVDLTTGHATRPTALGPSRPLEIGYAVEEPVGFWVGYAKSSPTAWSQLGDDDQLHGLAGKHRGPEQHLTFIGRAPQLSRTVPNVTADWDDKLLASAMRVGTSNRVVAAPSPGLIDHDTVTWSPDRAHLAFVAQLEDRCTPGVATAAAYVADAATGTVQELERATGGLAIEWIADREVAIAGDRGVSLVELGGATTALVGATGLVTPKRIARCTPETTDEPVPDEDPAEAGEPDAGVGSNAR